MPPAQLPINAFPTWALLNNVEFPSAKLRNVEGKGFGIVASKDVVSSGADASSASAILRVPRDLVLCAEAIEEYAKVDRNFKHLLETAGHQSARGDTMLYLLTHLALSKRGPSTLRGCVSTPWTEYVKFLPRPTPVPTMWSEHERDLLRGTSLEPALEAKLSTLICEFEELREKSSALQFWNSLFWEPETAVLEDWVLADAWYRSRCLELPETGHAMVPGLDMANHSQSPTAYYDEDHDGNVVLLACPGSRISPEEDITISYGDAKSAAEMLFSYGFIDKDIAAHELTLHLDAFPEDPLGKAKLHVFQGPPAVKLSRVEQTFQWDSSFAYLMCLNEEDGLEFRVKQDRSGDRQLRLFWQEEDVTKQGSEFETLIQNHPLCQVFKLRVVAVLEERVAMQLNRVSSGLSHDQLEQLLAAGQVNAACIQAVEILRDVEAKILEGVAGTLENEKEELLADARVVAYLRSMEEPQTNQAPGQPASDEEDFS